MPSWLPVAAALAGFVLHVPFVLRYDLHFQPDFAVSVLMSRAIAFEGERPLFFWGQGYLGTYGCYLTALLFRVFGVSIPLAAAVSLAIWAAGVGLATALAGRLLGGRAAWWTAAAAAIASPYANHYVAQPFTSYETAPVLAVLALAALAWGEGLARAGIGRRSLAAWAGLGLVLGLGWWTTRLFLPSLVAVLAAAALVHRQALPTRSAAAIAGVVLVAALVGAAPEIAYRLRGGATPQDTPSLGVASPETIATNVAQVVASLPAYLNGDPRARLPEGATFAHAIALGEDAYGGPELQPGPLASALDALVACVLAGIALAAGATALRARRERNAPLLALSLVLFVHAAMIALSAQTNGGYFEARRYWFASLLVLPVLVGNAVVSAERSATAAVRWGARTVAAIVLVSALVAQARMLARADDLADYRVLAREVAASGERALYMPMWDVWMVTALAGGTVDGVCTHYNRRPDQLERIARAPRMLAVLPDDDDEFPPTLAIEDAVFERTPDAPHPVGRWHWMRYARLGAD